MNFHIKYFVKKILNKLGWDLYRFEPHSSPQMQIITLLKTKKINVVFDVGANIGQFAKDLRSAGYDRDIVSFEPLSRAHIKLLDNSKKDIKWLIHSRCAIGDKNGKININISQNSVSSSVLSLKDKHLSAAPASAFIATENVDICTLDSVSERYLRSNSKLFIKIDTQGFEKEVISGAKNTISKAIGIICEISFVPLYKNQLLWREIIDILEKEGFALWALQKGLTDPNTGQSLQMDAIFVRKNKV